MRKTFHHSSVSGQALTWLFVMALLCIGGLLGYVLRTPGGQGINLETDSAITGDKAPGPASSVQIDPASTEHTQRTQVPSSASTARARQARPRVDGASPGEEPKPGAGNVVQNSKRLLAGLQRDPNLMQERMERLRRGQDDATRLAAAREILGDEAAGPMQSRALAVLMELDPDAVLGELQRMADGAAGDPRKSAMVQARSKT